MSGPHGADVQALTVHKAQGQTIERLRVDLGRVHIPGQSYESWEAKLIEPGQAYVAISRATSLDTLELRHFDRSL